MADFLLYPSSSNVRENNHHPVSNDWREGNAPRFSSEDFNLPFMHVHHRHPPGIIIIASLVMINILFVAWSARCQKKKGKKIGILRSNVSTTFSSKFPSMPLLLFRAKNVLFVFLPTVFRLFFLSFFFGLSFFLFREFYSSRGKNFLIFLIGLEDWTSRNRFG